MSQGLTYYFESPQTRALCDRFGWRLEELPLNSQLRLIRVISSVLEDGALIRSNARYEGFRNESDHEAFHEAIAILTDGEEPTGSDLSNILHGLAALLHG